MALISGEDIDKAVIVCDDTGTPYGAGNPMPVSGAGLAPVSTGQAASANSVPVVLSTEQEAKLDLLAKDATVAQLAVESGGNLDSIKTNTNNLVPIVLDPPDNISTTQGATAGTELTSNGVIAAYSMWVKANGSLGTDAMALQLQISPVSSGDFWVDVPNMVLTEADLVSGFAMVSSGVAKYPAKRARVVTAFTKDTLTSIDVGYIGTPA